MLAALIATASAAPVLGVDYVPLGRADLVAVDEDRTSGTGVGEFDGVLSPPLSAWGGVLNDRKAWLFGIAVAYQGDTAWSGNQRSTSRRGGVRLALDHRYYLVSPDQDTPSPWIQAGLYGIVPIASEHSDAWNDDEAAEMDAVAAEARTRIGGVGLRVGGGVELEITDGLTLGGRAVLIVHQGWEYGDSGQSASTALRTEPAITLSWRL